MLDMSTEDTRRQRALILVRRLQKSQGTERELDELMRELKEIAPHPGVLDLVFGSKPAMSAEEVVEKAFSYSPIPLDSG